MLDVKIKRLSDNAIIPTYGTSGSAGLDLYSTIDAHLAHELMISLDIALEIPEGYVGYIVPRSSLTKIGIDCSIGTIDSDYRGNIKVQLINRNYHKMGLFFIRKGQRVAQLVIMPLPKVNLVQSDILSDTERDTNGFGSTGT